MSGRDTLNKKNQIRKNNRLDLKKLIRINGLILEILRCVCTLRQVSLMSLTVFQNTEINL